MSADEAARAGHWQSNVFDLHSTPPSREGPIAPRIFKRSGAAQLVARSSARNILAGWAQARIAPSAPSRRFPATLRQAFKKYPSRRMPGEIEAGGRRVALRV
jgi:hypothetical protein